MHEWSWWRNPQHFIPLLLRNKDGKKKKSPLSSFDLFLPFTPNWLSWCFLIADAGKAALVWQVGAKVEFPPYQIVCSVSVLDSLLEIYNS